MNFISSSNLEKSHSANSAVLLSASLKALIWSSVRSSAITHGTSSIPSFSQALTLV